MSKAIRQQISPQARPYSSPSHQANGVAIPVQSQPSRLAATRIHTDRTAREPLQGRAQPQYSAEPRINRQMDAARQQPSTSTFHAHVAPVAALTNPVSSPLTAAIDSLDSAIRRGESLLVCFKLFEGLDQNVRGRIYLKLLAEYCTDTPLDPLTTAIDLFLTDPQRLVHPVRDFFGLSILDAVKTEILMQNDARTAPAPSERAKPQEKPQTIDEFYSLSNEMALAGIARLQSQRAQSAHREERKEDARRAQTPARPSILVQPSVSSSSRKPSTQEFLDFYSGKAPNIDGLTIQEILSWKHDQLENRGPFSHRYIQWLFPLYAESRFNKQAPLLNKVIVEEFRRSPEDPKYVEALQQNMNLAIGLMTEFWNFQLNHGDNWANASFQPIPGHRFHWLRVVHGHNHNFDRITRFLGSLKYLGFQSTALKFLAALEALAKTKEGRVIPEKTLRLWREAAGKVQTR